MTEGSENTKAGAAETGATPPRFRFTMTGRDGNVFALLARFQHAALRAGWSRAQVRQVFDDVTAGDYDHLLATLTKYADID